MLFKRRDGKPVKMDPLFRIIPLIMEERVDAQVYLEQEISVEAIDEYIKKKQKEGISIGYMHIIYSALVRTLKERPDLNRFIMNGRLYQRNAITISLIIKKDMTVDAEETSIKMDFRGDESPEEIKILMSQAIDKEKEGSGEDNQMDQLVKILDKFPHFLLKWGVKFLKWLDKHNLMPQSIVEASPFHASAFVTNLGSIGMDAIFHHIYNFGTIGQFLSIGKLNRRLAIKNGDLIKEKTITLAFVSDERICDGFYYASALRQLFKYLKNPEILEK